MKRKGTKADMLESTGKTKGKLIYRKLVDIKGLPKPFEKECRFELKSGLFFITHPTKLVSKDIIELDYCCAKSLEEAESEYDQAVKKFKALSYKYKSVILYQIEENGSYQDGSGKGFVFNWGVFRKINTGGEIEYVYERTYSGSKDIWTGAYIKNWKETKWSEQAENFFNTLSTQIESIYDKLKYFVTHVHIEEIKNIKLIGK